MDIHLMRLMEEKINTLRAELEVWKALKPDQDLRATIEAKDAEIVAAEARVKDYQDACIQKQEIINSHAVVEAHYQDDIAGRDTVILRLESELSSKDEEVDSLSQQLAEAKEWQERVDNSEWPSDWEFIVAKHEDELAEANQDTAFLVEYALCRTTHGQATLNEVKRFHKIRAAIDDNQLFGDRVEWNEPPQLLPDDVIPPVPQTTPIAHDAISKKRDT